MRLSRRSFVLVTFASWVSGTIALAEEALPFGGPYHLKARGDHVITEKSFPGKAKLIVFGFTHCPDICPTSLATIATAMKQLGSGADAIQTVFITLDPERDTPELLADYVAAFDPAFVGLSGTEKEIAAVARAFRVHRLKVRTGADKAGYTVDHGTLIYLVDEAGKTVTIFPLGTDVDKMVQVLRRRVHALKS
jgi:protein SCO2